MDLDAVMQKFDRESNTRIWEGKPKILVTWVLALFSIFCLYVTLFASWLEELRLTTFVDDVTISSQSQFKDLTPEMIRILERDGFRISRNKTSYKSGIVEITGVRCLNNSMTTTRKFKQKYEQRGTLSKATVQGLEQYRRRVKEISDQK